MTFDAPCSPLGSLESAGGGSGLGDFARTDAAGADTHPLWGLSDNYPDPLKVWIPPPVCPVIGVADPVAVHWALFTYFTTCHEADLLK